MWGRGNIYVIKNVFQSNKYMNLDGNGRVGNGYAIEVRGDGVAMITNYYGGRGGVKTLD